MSAFIVNDVAKLYQIIEFCKFCHSKKAKQNAFSLEMLYMGCGWSRRVYCGSCRVVFKQKPIDAAINRIKTSETHKLRIENTFGRKRNKNRWGLQNYVRASG